MDRHSRISAIAPSTLHIALRRYAFAVNHNGNCVIKDLGSGAIWISKLPKPLMGRDERIHVTPLFNTGSTLLSGSYDIEDMQQFARDLEITLVAGLVEGDQDFVRQASGVALWLGRRRIVERITHYYRSLRLLGSLSGTSFVATSRSSSLHALSNVDGDTG